MRKLCLSCVIAAAMAIGACGGSSSSGSSDSTGAASTPAASTPAAAPSDAALDQARQPIAEFPGPTDSPGPIPSGKRLAVVYIIAAPFPTNLVKGTEEAAKAVGWSVRTYNAKGTPPGIQSAMSLALSSRPDAIVLAAMPAALMQAQLGKAKAAGIPVVALSPGMPDDMSASQANLVNVIQYDRHKVGKTLGDWVVDKWPDGAEVTALTSPEFVSLATMSKDFVATVKGAGEGFTVGKTVASPVTDPLGQAGVTRLASLMRSYPDAKAVYINSESWFSTFLQAAKAARNSKIVGVGADGDVSIPLVKRGAPIVMMGSDSTTYGWYGVDSLIRHFNKKSQPTYTVPVRLVDSQNAGSIETDGIRVGFDNAAAWKKLWGAG